MIKSEHKIVHAYAHYSSGTRGNDAMAKRGSYMKRERQRRMRLSYVGEALAARMYDCTVWLRGKREAFDVVNIVTKIAYEVKTMHVDCIDKKIHISDDSMQRKQEWLREHGYEGKLVVVVTDGQSATIYQSELIQHVRIHQLEIAYDDVKI